MPEDEDCELSLSNWTLVFQGAESRVYSGRYRSKLAIMKERFEKKYRLPELDRKLTRERIRAEIKAYEKISKKCPQLAALMPIILFSDDRTLVMTKLEDACNVSQFIQQNESSDQAEVIQAILVKLGVVIAKIHKCGIIHGDLTTSNFMVKTIHAQQEMIPIDFGLSTSSTTDEDRAVDLYVLERAFESSHPKIGFEKVLEAYKTEMGNDKTIKRLNTVRARGRKRLAIG